MNKTQALQEAKKRWGNAALISHHPNAPTAEDKKGFPPKDVRHLQHRCDVGYAWQGLFFNILGSGDTWEEAFAKVRTK